MWTLLFEAAKEEVICEVSSDRTSPPSLALGGGNVALRGSNGEGWCGGGIAVSKAAFFRRIVLDQQIPTEFMFTLFRTEESFPQREALSGVPLLGSS